MEQQREILQARARFRLVSTQRMFADRERPSIQRFDRVVVSQGLEQSSEVIDDRSQRVGVTPARRHVQGLPRFGTSTEELQLSTPCYSLQFVIIYIMRSRLPIIASPRSLSMHALPRMRQSILSE